MKRAPLDVVCFGEILWDLFEIQGRFVPLLGGAPANVATGLARLGLRSAVVGGIGRDRFGKALADHLARDGVDTRFLIWLPNRTGITFVYRDGRGEPDFLFYRHETADVSVRKEHITPAMARARWVLVGTSTLVTPPLAEATVAFLDHAVRSGAHVFVDLNIRAHLWSSRAQMVEAVAGLVRRAALIKASDADLAHVAGRRKGEAWLAQHAPGASWLVTRGAGSATATGAHGEVSRPAKRARCVDATGAGDAFIAGALASLIAAGATPGSAAWRNAGTWTRALDVGHMLGAKAISRPGAVAGLTHLGNVRAAVERSKQERVG